MAVSFLDSMRGRPTSSGKSEFIIPSDEKELVGWLERKRKAGRTPLPEYQMKLNLSFVLGHQWLTWDTSAKTLRRVSAPRASDPNAPVRITVNKIGGLVERIVSKLTKSAPLPEARPVSDDEKDVAAARVATRIMAHEFDRLGWRAWLTEFLFWPATFGWSYAHIYWEPDAGSTLAEDDDGRPIRMGDIEYDIVPANELSVDPSALSMDKARWAIRTTVMSREALWETWGVEIPGEPEARSMVEEVLQMAHLSQKDEGGSSVAVHQMWMLTSRAAPKGMTITWSGNTILEPRRDFPFEHGRLPFAQMNWLPPLGTLRGRTWVDDLIPMQEDYNDARSREATIRRTLVPKLLYPTGSIDMSRVTTRIEGIPYAPTGQPPTWLSPDSGWMQQQEAVMARADGELGQRAGVNEASAGQAGASTPAAAILALQEADDTKLAVTATMLAQFIKEVGEQVLGLTRQYWTEERTIRVYSEEGGGIDVYRYEGANLDGGYDVRVSSESALPKSKAARVQLGLELHARGVIPNNQDLLRILELPGTDFIIRDMDLDTRKQRRELAVLLKGEDCEVAPYDDHAIHLAQINRFRKTEEYERLPETIRARIDAHAAVHESLVLRQAGIPQPVSSLGPSQPDAAGAAAAIGARGARGSVGAAQNSGHYMTDFMTGTTPDPLMSASGQQPSPVTDEGIYNAAGIGGTGQPGRVPGVPADNQAASMGG